jgi:hypothetical protein
MGTGKNQELFFFKRVFQRHKRDLYLQQQTVRHFPVNIDFFGFCVQPKMTVRAKQRKLNTQKTVTAMKM